MNRPQQASNTWSSDDKNITAATRRILASYWVDLTRLNVRTTHGNIYIGGHMRRMTFEHSEMDDKMLRIIDGDLRMLDKVRSVIYDLDNWELDDNDIWHAITPEEAKHLHRQSGKAAE